jgi:hypothetical protein
MTKEEFEKGYADQSGVSLESLKEYGLFAYPCDCGEFGCKGWQMMSMGPDTSVYSA